MHANRVRRRSTRLVHGYATLDTSLEGPEIALQMLRVVSRRLRRARYEVTEFLSAGVAGRVARQLIGLARRYGTVHNGELRVPHNLTQAQLADLVGASHETVNKALADFANRGWIRVGSRGVIILNHERLAERVR